MIVSLLLTIAFALGFAQIIRALPGARAIQAWLEGTWTHGKPLSCWLCLSFWGALLCAFLQPGGSVLEDCIRVVGAAGIAALVGTKLDPIVPAAHLPPLEMSDAPDVPRPGAD